MGSFKRNGRNQGPNRRRGKSSPGRQGFPRIESLEERRLLSGGGDGPSARRIWTPTSTNLFDAQNGPMANLGVGIVNVYEAYCPRPATDAASSRPSSRRLSSRTGWSVVQLKSLGGDFSQFSAQLTEVGMNVTTSSSYYGAGRRLRPDQRAADHRRDGPDA